MPKFTKPYWVDWQGETKIDDGWGASGEPETSRRRVTLPRTVVPEPADSSRSTARMPQQEPPADDDVPPSPRDKRLVGAGAPAPSRSRISDLGPPSRTILDAAPPPRTDREDVRRTIIDATPPFMDESGNVIDVPTMDFVPEDSERMEAAGSGRAPSASGSATGARTVQAPAQAASDDDTDDGDDDDSGHTVSPRALASRNARVEIVDDDEESDIASAKPANAMVVHTRSSGGTHYGRSDPPHIVVARHELTPELSGDPRLIIVREPDSELAAAYRVLRHQLVQNGNPQVVVVSSALPGEGKTTCALNLALALGECNRARVLLVEANFRRPRLGGIFRFEPPWCFAQQIAEHRNHPLERWSVVEVAPHGLHVIAVDPRTEQRPLLDAPAFALAIERLRLAGYDYIVIDSPPVLGSAEVNLLQDAADGVLLTARSGRSRGRHLKKAIEQISPGTIFGVALLHF